HAHEIMVELVRALLNAVVIGRREPPLGTKERRYSRETAVPAICLVPELLAGRTRSPVGTRPLRLAAGGWLLIGLRRGVPCSGRNRTAPLSMSLTAPTVRTASRC